jgi:hypothetical protein
MPEHEERFPRFLTSKEKEPGKKEKERRKQIENHASKPASLSHKEKTGSCGPVITVTAEWSEHGFAEPKKSSEEETHTPKTLTPNYDESIFVASATL